MARAYANSTDYYGHAGYLPGKVAVALVEVVLLSAAVGVPHTFSACDNNRGYPVSYSDRSLARFPGSVF